MAAGFIAGWGLGGLVASTLFAAPPPEVLQVYDGKVEFNEEFDRIALVRLARTRAAMRHDRKRRNSLRYHHRYYQRAHAGSCGNQNAINPLGRWQGVAKCGCRA